jgi:hypothetical protein
MATTLTLSGTTDTATTATIAGTPSGIHYYQIQYGTNPDFAWRPAPIVALAATGSTSFTLSKFNQDCTYYIRGRALDATLTPLEAWSPTQGFRTAHTASPDYSVPAVVISPALIVPPEPVLTWNADNPIAGYPARCLGIDDPSCALWSTLDGGNNVGIEAQLAGAPIDTIAVLETMCPEDTTITVIGDTTIAGARSGSPDYRYGPVAFRPSVNLPGRGGYHGFVRLPAPQSYPYWRIVITGKSPGVFVATYAVLGLARVAKNYTQIGKSEDVTDLGTFDRARNGSPIRSSGKRLRKVAFDISFLTTLQEQQFRDLGDRIGLTSPVLVVPNSKTGVYLHDQILYGTMAARKSAGTSALNFTDSFTFDSLI